MSNRDDDLYRGDPPAGSTAAGAGHQPSSSAPADRDQTTRLPQPGYTPPPGHNPSPGYGPAGQPAAGPGAPGYGAPGYGASGYGASGYGAPPGYGPPPGYPPQPYGTPPGYPPQAYGMPGWPRPTNTIAVLALVMAFVFAPAGLVLGIVARKQIQRTGEEGSGLALAGIIIGGIATAFFVLALVAWIIAFVSLGEDFAP